MGSGLVYLRFAGYAVTQRQLRRIKRKTEWGRLKSMGRLLCQQKNAPFPHAGDWLSALYAMDLTTCVKKPADSLQKWAIYLTPQTANRLIGACATGLPIAARVVRPVEVAPHPRAQHSDKAPDPGIEPDPKARHAAL